MTKYYNEYEDITVDSWDEVQDFIDTLDGSDFENYIKTNYGDYFEMCVEIIQYGVTKIGKTIYKSIDKLNADLFEEMKNSYQSGWIPYDDDADCLKRESDD